ncbi:hypothetical protein C5L14_12125 [Labrys okinawensis]|uniref:Uncharacterized protein n=1 Tax=Labrys okinawensis TaxID=346911 RepID=A0A2S9QDE6_9HYPH|nr:hypothetical protein [Labrys okinawensis]PRH87364.1 hypothetical protein C5L14_12125 [Labrys okinawensis]
MSDLPSDDQLRSTLARTLGLVFEDWSMPDPTRMELDVEQAIRLAVRRAWPDLTVTTVVAGLRHEGEVDTIELLVADTRSGARRRYLVFP